MEENKSGKKRNRRKLMSLFVALLVFSVFLVLGGFTYAYFTIRIEGAGADIDIQTATGLGLTYTDGSDAILTQAYPGDKVVKTFTLTNDTDATGYYEIGWREVTNTFVGTDLVYKLEKTSTNGHTTSEVVMPTTNASIAANIEILARDTHTYELTVEFKETGVDQNSNQGQTFTGKIQIFESVLLEP